ncbi:sensor histidine kinase [Cohnella suwonensis]|uniref:histidine kinase n=1 Tax=Cohnella suwonensis TaxID=696072 RepID=A0ABW0LQH8_9BACL
MYRFMGRFNRHSITAQFLYLIIIMLAVLLISFVVSNRIAERIIEKKVTDTSGKILLQVEDKMISFYSDMEGISTYLLYSPTVQTYLSSGDALAKILKNDEIISMVSNTMTLKDDIKGIQLYDKDGMPVTSIGVETGESVRYPIRKAYYSGLIAIPDGAGAGNYYSITYPIFNLKSSQVWDYGGTSVFMMDVNNFNQILKNAKVTESSRLWLLDQNNRIMADEGNGLQSGTFSIDEWNKDERFIVQTESLPHSGWKLISAIPKNELLRELNTVQRLNIATYAVMFCILGLFLILFFSRILKPIRSLMDFMKSYPRKGGESRVQVVAPNEIGVLAANLNKMLDEIDTLGKEIQLTQKQKYEIEISKKQMEISAFRNQINPHFLYNTLECIRAIAFYYKVQEIADISTSLSNMFRYSVKGSDFVHIRDELFHIGEYAKIIEYRFIGRIRVAIEADEDVLEATALKMLVQPIVENAVFHGLEKKIDDGIVRIQVHKTPQNQIQYVIRDNGYGMDDKQLKELNDRLRHFDSQSQTSREAKHGIGLSNIYRRIKLFYGDEADMNIESRPGFGTTVTINFPLQHDAEQLEVL